jgi:hypothetical protein
MRINCDFKKEAFLMISYTWKINLANSGCIKGLKLKQINDGKWHCQCFQVKCKPRKVILNGLEKRFIGFANSPKTD